MGDKIKTAIEIAMEKAALLDDLSEEEKEKIKNNKELTPLMAAFYKGDIDPDKMWEKLKGKNEPIFNMAQENILDSIKFNTDEAELLRRGKGIIAIESLKKEQKTALFQKELNHLGDLQKKALIEKDNAFNEFKEAIENNPNARNRVIEQNGVKAVIKLSVEEAITQNPQWKQFLQDLKNNYEAEFDATIKIVKDQINT